MFPFVAGCVSKRCWWRSAAAFTYQKHQTLLTTTSFCCFLLISFVYTLGLCWDYSGTARRFLEFEGSNLPSPQSTTLVGRVVSGRAWCVTLCRTCEISNVEVSKYELKTIVLSGNIVKGFFFLCPVLPKCFLVVWSKSFQMCKTHSLLFGFNELNTTLSVFMFLNIVPGCVGFLRCLFSFFWNVKQSMLLRHWVILRYTNQLITFWDLFFSYWLYIVQRLELSFSTWI